MDLTAAEGLADLIDAETEAQRRQALVQAGGGLARLYDGWRERLLAARGLAEAAIDFSDETDVAADALAGARREAEMLLAEVEAHLADGHRGEIVRDGFRVVLAGPPNVGKSSLLNALTRRDVAIVSPEAGTTRDVLEVRLDLGGYAVVLTDTAGIRDAEGAIEAEGIRRTLERARDADLVLWLVDAASIGPARPVDLQTIDAPILVVANKADLIGEKSKSEIPVNAILVSAVSGAGLAELIARLAAEVSAKSGGGDAPPVLSQERHRLGLSQGRDALRRILLGADLGAELQAEELRLAADALGRVVGRVDVEDVLGQIFGRFCIGK